MSQGELADRRTARGRGPAGTEAHHALLQDEATRNFASSKTVLNQNFRTLLRTATASRVFRPMELRAGEALRGRSLQDRAEPPVITGGKIAAVGIDRTRRIREGRNDSHDPKLDAQQNGELIKPTTTVAQTVAENIERSAENRMVPGAWRQKVQFPPTVYKTTVVGPFRGHRPNPSGKNRMLCSSSVSTFGVIRRPRRSEARFTRKRRHNAGGNREWSEQEPSSLYRIILLLLSFVLLDPSFESAFVLRLFSLLVIDPRAPARSSSNCALYQARI